MAGQAHARLEPEQRSPRDSCAPGANALTTVASELSKRVACRIARELLAARDDKRRRRRRRRHRPSLRSHSSGRRRQQVRHVCRPALARLTSEPGLTNNQIANRLARPPAKISARRGSAAVKSPPKPRTQLIHAIFMLIYSSPSPSPSPSPQLAAEVI